jgi:hypothetical protein
MLLQLEINKTGARASMARQQRRVADYCAMRRLPPITIYHKARDENDFQRGTNGKTAR